MEWTNEQRKAFSTRGGSILVSASAGSGKTAVLTERVLNLLTEEPRCDINRLLILTFTKASAAEMRQRIKDKIEETIGKDPEKYRYLRRQLMLLDSAEISTVDAFCNNLIRENYEKTGISFDVKTAEPGDIEIIRTLAAEKLIDEFITDENRDIFDSLDIKNNDNAIIDNIVENYQAVSSHPFPDKWMKDSYEKYDTAVPFEKTVYYDILTGKIRNICLGVSAFIDKKLRTVPKVNAEKSCRDILLSDKEHITGIINGIDKRNYSDLLKILSEPFINLRTYGNENEALKDEIKLWRNAYKDKISKPVKALFDFTEEEYISDTEKLKPAVGLYLDLLKKYGEIFSEMKRERNIIDYADMEDMVIRVLYDEKDGDYVVSDAARELREQFDEIMVDEFQDTNAKQNAIYYALSKDGDNLFCVGDIKQSIYRFRLADPGIFSDMRKKCTPDAFPMLVDLSDNFRSSESVCNTVNGIFSHIMSETVGEIDYGQTEMLRCNTPGDAKTEIYISDKDDSTSEAEMLSDIIQDLTTNGITENGTVKPVRYGDIAILFRSAKKWTNYTGVFKSHGIPVYAGETEGFLCSRECDSLLSLLRAVDNPYSDISLVSAMMSPVFCFVPDDILVLRASGEKHIFDAMAKSDDMRTAEFYHLIKRYKELSFSVPVSELIKIIMSETDFPYIYSSFYGGETRKSNLMKLLKLAKTKEESTSLSLSYFLSYCEKIKSGGDTSPVTAGDPDAVRMMTIHGSKGLEFPVCILAEADRKFNIRDLSSAASVSPELGVCMRVRDHKRFFQYKTVQSNAYAVLQEKNELSEEMRILYVALTRAKNKLIITASEKDRDKFLQNVVKTVTDEKPGDFIVSDRRSFLWWVLLGVLTTEVTDTPAFPGCFVREGLPVDVVMFSKEDGEKEEAIPAKPDEEVLGILYRSRDFVYKEKALREVPVRMSVSEISEAKNAPSFSARPSFSEKKDSTAAERGTATHKFMQFTDYEKASSDLGTEACRLINEHFMSEKEISLCDMNSIRRFFESDTYKRIVSADRILKEYPFMYGISAERVGISGTYKDETVLVQGIADLITVKDGKFSVIDYKTDSVTNEETLKERYTGQLRLYGEALTEKLSLPCEGLIIYSFSLGKEIML